MRTGLFGKLQSKRDFIALDVPRSFLTAWEPWLQGGISASRMSLAEGWRDAFLTAPIWRFWLGADVCGGVATGAIMPSMDGVGRYFPLTLVAFADDNETPAPPEIDAHDEWFVGVEDFLFSTLEANRAFEDITADLARLPPCPVPRGEQRGDIVPFTPMPGLLARGDQHVSQRFQATRTLDYRNAYASMSFWWTAGGQDYAPLALATPRLPDPHLFTGMLTGDFENCLARAEDAS